MVLYERFIAGIDSRKLFFRSSNKVIAACQRKAHQVATSPNLQDMKLSELKELARQMGLRGTSSMRKGDLLATLQAARSGGKAPAGVTVEIAVPQSAPAQADSHEEPSAKDAAEQAVAAISRAEVTVKEDRANRGEHAERNDQAEVDADGETVTRRRRRPVEDLPEEPLTARRVRSRRGEANRQKNAEQNESADRSQQPNEAEERDLNDILASLPSDRDAKNGNEARDNRETDRETNDRDNRGDRSERNDRSDRSDRNEHRRGRNHDRNNDRNDRSDRNEHRRGRNRNRDERDEERNERNDRNNDRNNERNNDRRNANNEREQEELVPVAGIVDVLESYAFVRTSGYLPGPNDVYVSMSQIKKYGLRKGDAVHGSIRPPHEGDRRNQRQKFVPLQSIDSINGMSVEQAQNRPNFNKLTPLYPNERLKQETTQNGITGRLIDIVAPIGKGQRGLIVSPPKAGKTITLQNIANAIAMNNPEVHLMVVLVDERPEEVTDMERTVQGEVISSTFDRPATDHTTVAELAIERAKRLVELGQDVVVLLDSMTRLARAYNIAAPASGRILSGGVDAQALYPPKKFFGAARNIENGGSLTIISSALVETGSKMDEVIFEEFKGTGNMELRLSRELADKRMFPAVDINASGTRREELITNPQELPIIYRLRRLLGGMEPEQAYQTIVPRLKKTATNRDFLASLLQG